MSVQGQKAKYSPRADVFRFTPNNGHAVTAPPWPFRAITRQSTPMKPSR